MDRQNAMKEVISQRNVFGNRLADNSQANEVMDKRNITRRKQLQVIREHMTNGKHRRGAKAS